MTQLSKVMKFYYYRACLDVLPMGWQRVRIESLNKDGCKSHIIFIPQILFLSVFKKPSYDLSC